jgi:AAA domain, putative AbiEii toxin, Type IV TA system
MYIDLLYLKNVRIFADAWLDFICPDQSFRARRKTAGDGPPLLPRPRLPNVNLLLGENGSGKSTVLRAIAMAALGPSFEDAKLPTQGLVRREKPHRARPGDPDGSAIVEAALVLHDEDGAPGAMPTPGFRLKRRGELEQVKFAGDPEKYRSWDPVFESKNDAFFAVGYGATRRVEAPENLDMAARSRLTFLRGQRLQGLFQESFTLIPLETWLPGVREREPGRYREVANLLDALLKPGHCRFTGERERDVDFLFDFGGARVPFRWMSDGYRAFIGWVGDLLFHACYACPADKKLVDLRGIVMVDDIDLQLHPRWQMKVIKTIARTFPRLQFILTSHSPLVAGSLEWMNITTLKFNNRTNATRACRLTESIHGLDADQVLISEFFGLKTTRAESKARQLDALTIRAALGDDRAAERLISKMAEGMEESG